MNTRKNHKSSKYRPGIIVRLWGIMMVLILFTVAFMWIFQIHFMERSYIDSNIIEMQEQLEPALSDLEIQDLAYNDKMISYLCSASHGKMLILNKQGELLAMYSYGLPIDLEENHTDILLWERIANSEDYQKILSGEAYTRKYLENNRIKSYETGIPVQYYGQNAYLVLYRSFDELYAVLDMNRHQLIILSIILALTASVLAALFAKNFARPILTIKRTVDCLAQGDLTATTGLIREDEIGQLADSVEKLGKALQRVDVLRKEVIANVSHELRAPLALIGGYAEMVKDITWKNEIQRNENLDLIMNEAHRMSEMVNDIMDYSQLQSGYLQLKIDEYDLCEIVETEALHCKRNILENHLTLEIEHPGREYTVKVDALKISQVIRNLINNAVNHTQDGNVITVSIKESHDGYKVSVINPGEPIPEEDKALIWERYGRSQHQGARRQGTGIGLSIVSTILNAHNMPYGVECAEGLTCFWFLYPSFLAKSAIASDIFSC